MWGQDHLTSNQEEAFAKTHLLRPKISEMSALTLLTMFRATSVAQRKEIMQLLTEEAAVVPEAEPAASDYRLCAADIDHSTCLARVLKGGEDKRWKPIIYRESQCGKKQVEGGDLCTRCTKNEAAYDGSGGHHGGPWRLRVTEEPPGWLHMLGTAWATDKPPVFNASASSSSSASSSASTVGDSDSDAESKDAAKATKAAAKAEAKAAKEAAAVEKTAAKEAAAAAKAAKEAEKAAEKAEKAAAKAIKDAAAAVTAAAKKTVPKPKEE